MNDVCVAGRFDVCKALRGALRGLPNPKPYHTKSMS